jgi:hypothetical protein
MALTLEATMQNAIADAIDDLINTGAGVATFKFETAGDVAVATMTLQNPAFGDAVAGLITLNGLPLQDTNAAGGEVAKFSIYDRDGVKQLEGTVTATGNGGDIELPSLTVPAGAILQLTTLSIQVPA